MEVTEGKAFKERIERVEGEERMERSNREWGQKATRQLTKGSH
jgi:hypothetical protein